MAATFSDVWRQVAAAIAELDLLAAFAEVAAAAPGPYVRPTMLPAEGAWGRGWARTPCWAAAQLGVNRALFCVLQPLARPPGLPLGAQRARLCSRAAGTRAWRRRRAWHSSQTTAPCTRWARRCLCRRWAAGLRLDGRGAEVWGGSQPRQQSSGRRVPPHALPAAACALQGRSWFQIITGPNMGALSG